MRLLFLGDIIGKPGRRAVTKLLPELQREFRPEFVVANVENLAHGKGVTTSTLQEVLAAGVGAATGGNHTFDKPEAAELYAAEPNVLVRPMNLPAGTPGQGVKTFQVGQKSVMVVNLMGEFGMNLDDVENPFAAIQRWWQTGPTADVILVDFHAEATSEKVNLGWYLDGKVAAMVGTHTHVPTADARVLPRGTGYITDVGMIGLRDSSLGVDKDLSLQRFLTGVKASNDIPDQGVVAFNAMVITTDSAGRCTTIEHLYREITIA